jgi:hypothetical protein
MFVAQRANAQTDSGTRDQTPHAVIDDNEFAHFQPDSFGCQGVVEGRTPLRFRWRYSAQDKKLT